MIRHIDILHLKKTSETGRNVDLKLIFTPEKFRKTDNRLVFWKTEQFKVSALPHLGKNFTTTTTHLKVNLFYNDHLYYNNKSLIKLNSNR